MNVTIYNPNYVGINGQITFVNNSGETFYLGNQLVPFNYEAEDAYGTYYVYYSQWGVTCEYTLTP